MTGAIMNFGESIKFGFNNYATFQGRSRRSGYWYWTLFNAIVSAVFSILSSGQSDNFFGIIGSLAGLALLLPGLAYGVRRLHDTNRSGWNLLFALIPLIGAIILLVFFVQDSDAETNRFGTNPKAA
jgi:uncharacterized membrane protein YhaH (DUF805 family)